MTFRIELKVRNAPLYRAIHDQHKNVHAFCVAHDLQPGVVGEFLNLKKNPLLTTLEWSKPALDVADALGVLPDEIFPEACQIQLQSASAAFEVSAREIEQIVGESSPLRLAMESERIADVLDALKTINPREEEVLKLRFGLNDGHEYTFQEIGKRLGVSVGRARQIEAKALRKLRNLDNAHYNNLREHAGLGADE